MNAGAALLHLFPLAENGVDYKVVTVAGVATLTEWNLAEPQPDEATLAAGWLEYSRAQKLDQLKAACRAAIERGLSHSALGAEHLYPSSITDQVNLHTQYTDARTYGDASPRAPFKIQCVDGAGVKARRAHSATQAIEVAEALKAHVTAQLDTLEALAYAAATAETLTELENIAWPA